MGVCCIKVHFCLHSSIQFASRLELSSVTTFALKWKNFSRWKIRLGIKETTKRHKQPKLDEQKGERRLYPEGGKFFSFYSLSLHFRLQVKCCYCVSVCLCYVFSFFFLCLTSYRTKGEAANTHILVLSPSLFPLLRSSAFAVSPGSCFVLLCVLSLLLPYVR